MSTERENKKPTNKPQKRNPYNMGELVLKQHKYFDVVLQDGEQWTCKLLDYGQFDLLLETEKGKILLPKHSIKYFVVEAAD